MNSKRKAQEQEEEQEYFEDIKKIENMLFQNLKCDIINCNTDDLEFKPCFCEDCTNDETQVFLKLISK